MNIGISKTCSSLERICLPVKSVLSKNEAAKMDLCLEVPALLTKACLLVNNDNHFGKSPLLLWNWPCSLNSRMALHANQITSNAAVKSRLMKHHLLGRVNKDPKDYHQIAFSFGLQERSAKQSTASSPIFTYQLFYQNRNSQKVLASTGFKGGPCNPVGIICLSGMELWILSSKEEQKASPRPRLRD